MSTFWGGSFEGVLPEHISAVVARYSFFDLPVCRAMLTFVREDDVVLDIGAHFGFFSLLGSWLVGPRGKVVAVEAIGTSYSQLRRNVHRHAACPNIETVNTAAGDREGTLQFNDYGLEFSSLNSAFGARGPMGGHAEHGSVRIEVPMRRMDDLVSELDLDRVDFVKIDTESSEHLVLAGIVDTLEQFHPLISMEVSDVTIEERAHTIKIMAIMDQHGYRPHRFADGRIEPCREGEAMSYDNLLFGRPDDPRLMAALSP